MIDGSKRIEYDAIDDRFQFDWLLHNRLCNTIDNHNRKSLPNQFWQPWQQVHVLQRTKIYEYWLKLLEADNNYQRSSLSKASNCSNCLGSGFQTFVICRCVVVIYVVHFVVIKSTIGTVTYDLKQHPQRHIHVFRKDLSPSVQLSVQTSVSFSSFWHSASLRRWTVCWANATNS